MKITPNLFSFLEGEVVGGKKRKKRIAKAALGGATSIDNGFVKSDALTLIKDVKALAQRTGGYEQLKHLVDALAE